MQTDKTKVYYNTGCTDGPSCPTVPTSTTTAPVTCPETDCPTVTCPETDCPTVTCPETDCPTVTCPPTQQPPVSSSGVALSLGDQSYPNNSIILFDDIGEAANALLCTTDRVECCSGSSFGGGGRWYFPNGSEAVSGFLDGSIYRNRGPQIVRLNRRNDAQSPNGIYRCEIPDARGNTQKLFVTIISSAGIFWDIITNFALV